MEELRQQLSALTMREVVQRMEFLNDQQRSDYQKYIYKLWRGHLPLDVNDDKAWSNCKYYIWMSLPMLLVSRLTTEYLRTIPPQQNIHLRRATKLMTMHKGFIVGFALCLIPIHQTIQYTTMVSYKHYILSQQ